MPFQVPVTSRLELAAAIDAGELMVLSIAF
jgi:hypothetical protein